MWIAKEPREIVLYATAFPLAKLLLISISLSACAYICFLLQRPPTFPKHFHGDGFITKIGPEKTD